MNKNFKKLALMGLATGLLTSGQAVAESNQVIITPGQEVAAACGSSCGAQRPQSSGRDRRYNPVADSTYDQRYDTQSNWSNFNNSSPQTSTTESALLQQLNPQSKAMYQSFDRATKDIVLRTASQFSDKNEAVRAAAQQQKGNTYQPRQNNYNY